MEGKKFGGNEVVVMISDSQESLKDNGELNGDSIGLQENESGSCSFSKYLQGEPTSRSQFVQLTEQENLESRKKVLNLTSTSTLEIPKLSPPRPMNESMATPTRRRSLARSAYSRPKSRLVEPSVLLSNRKSDEVKESTQLPFPAISNYTSPSRISPSGKTSSTTPKTSAPITPRTPLMASPSGDGEDDDDDVYGTTGSLQANQARKPAKKVKLLFLIELILFVCIVILFIASLTVNKLQNSAIWDIEIWKWCVLALVIFCGRLVTGWFINVLVFLIERNFLLKKKVLYFVYSLQKSVRVFLWLGLVLLAWGLLISRGGHRTKDTRRILNYITRALAATLIGAALWMLKTLFIKLLASAYHVRTFFDRIQDSIFHQYVLQTLSGPPLMEYDEQINSSFRHSGRLSVKSTRKGNKGEKEEVVDVDKLHKIKREKVSAWTMGGLIKIIRKSGLSTLSDALDQSENADDEESEQKEKKITNELEAKTAANRIFKNVATQGQRYIEEKDLLRFMYKDEVDNLLPLFEGVAETGKIKKQSFINWVVSVYNERKFLAHSLNDTKTAIEELNKIVSGIVLIVILIVWLLLMGFATTKVLVFISSQLLLVVFIFGNTGKTVFEAIIFVFVMHPFDVGDRCVIDGLQMIVEEMNILTTVFLRYDNEKIFYPNAVLATKAISNFNRSPEMYDSVEFDVDVSTSFESIAALKAKIKAYVESKPLHWRPNHSVRVKEIEDVNKMKMGLSLAHTINFQNIGDKLDRRSDLVLELKKIFEELGIKYHLLPQEVHLRHLESASQPGRL